MSIPLWSDVTALFHCFKQLHASVVRKDPVMVEKYDDYASKRTFIFSFHTHLCFGYLPSVQGLDDLVNESF